MAANEFPLFAHWMDWLRWLLPTTEKFPKRLRFTLTQRIDNLALDIAEDPQKTSNEIQTSLEADTKVPLKTQQGLFSSGLRTEMR